MNDQPMFSSEVLTTTGEDCGRTKIVRQTVPSLLAAGETWESVQLFRCVREPEHEGEHFAVLVHRDETTMTWSGEAVPR